MSRLSSSARAGALLLGFLLVATGQGGDTGKVVSLVYEAADLGFDAIAFNPTERLLYVASGDSILVFDERRSTVADVLYPGDASSALYYNCTTHSLYAAACSLARLNVFAVQQTGSPHTIALPDVARRLVPDTLRNRLLVLCRNGRLAIVDCLDDDVEAVVPACDSFVSWSPVAYADSLDRLYVGEVTDRSVLGIDCAAESLVATVKFDSVPVGLLFHGTNGKLYCSCRKDRSLRVVDALTGQVVDSVPGAGSFDALCSNPVRNKVYVGTYVVDASADTVMAELDIESASILTWCPGSNKVYLITSSW